MKVTRSANAYMVEVGRVIRQFRERAVLSQEQLAEIADLHRTYIGAVERGERNLTIVSLHRIATALKSKPSDLLLAVEAKLKQPGKGLK